MSAKQTHCAFCDLINGAGEVSVCYEDSDAMAFMDIQPVNSGHVLVAPRQHYESLFDVPAELGDHLFHVTMRMAGAIRRVTGCEDMNIVVSSGAAAGQDVFHYHVHIIPRREGDGFDVQLPFDGSQMPDRTMLDAMAARIISAMRDPMKSGSGSGGGGDSSRLSALGNQPSTTIAAPTAEGREPSAESRVQSDREVLRVVAREGRDEGGNRRLRAHEGPHGELIRDDTEAVA
jgi:histidine triad (HIT) family protein